MESIRFDFSDLPVVDNHCHPYVVATDGQRYSALDTFLGVPGEGEAALSHREAMVYQRWATRMLAGFLECDPTPKAVAVARAAESDERAYRARLFADAGLDTLVTDMGYPQPPIGLDTFREATPIQVAPLYRIEPTIKTLIEGGVGYDELIRRFDESAERAIRDEGYRGLKSIIAYRTGLDVDVASADEAAGRRGLDEALAEPGSLPASKRLRDHLLCRTAALAIELGVPLQIHTGFGDVDILLRQCNPAGLSDFLKHRHVREARVVLVHCYPFLTEAAFLAAALPNVWCDLSLGIPFAPAAADRIIATALELAPANRILFGSDACYGPEQSWLGAKLAKEALARVLSDYCDRGLLTEAEARETASGFLSENARALYGLGKAA